MTVSEEVKQQLSEWGRRGGQARSERKTQSSRANAVKAGAARRLPEDQLTLAGRVSRTTRRRQLVIEQLVGVGNFVLDWLALEDVDADAAAITKGDVITKLIDALDSASIFLLKNSVDSDEIHCVQGTHERQTQTTRTTQAEEANGNDQT